MLQKELCKKINELIYLLEVGILRVVLVHETWDQLLHRVRVAPWWRIAMVDVWRDLVRTEPGLLTLPESPQFVGSLVAMTFEQRSRRILRLDSHPFKLVTVAAGSVEDLAGQILAVGSTQPIGVGSLKMAEESAKIQLGICCLIRFGCLLAFGWWCGRFPHGGRFLLQRSNAISNWALCAILSHLKLVLLAVVRAEYPGFSSRRPRHVRLFFPLQSI